MSRMDGIITSGVAMASPCPRGQDVYAFCRGQLISKALHSGIARRHGPRTL